MPLIVSGSGSRLGAFEDFTWIMPSEIEQGVSAAEEG